MWPRKRAPCLITILLLIKSTEQYGSGAPPTACQSQRPNHEGMLPQSSVPPYFIQTSSTQVRQGDTVNVTVGSLASAPVPIGGFLLQAREIQNPDVIVGKFVNGPLTMSKFTSCSHKNDTATHISPADKPALTFTWQAPTDFLGGVEFSGTVAQQYSTFWSGIKSPLLEVVAPEDPRDVIYQGCADNKLCFGFPDKCIERSNCVAIVAISVAGDVYTFEIQGTGNPKYVATALSMDKKMGNDSAMECVRNDNGRVSLFTSWTYPKSEPYVSRSDSPQDIVQMLESSFIDGKLYCKFRRDVVSTVKGITYDLANNKYNLMVVSGSSMKDTNQVGFHNNGYGFTEEALTLSRKGATTGTPHTHKHRSRLDGSHLARDTTTYFIYRLLANDSISL